MPTLTSESSRRIAAAVLVVAVALASAGCSTAPTPTPGDGTSAQVAPQPPPEIPRRELAADPAPLAADLVADERAIRDPRSTDVVLTAAAHRQQAAYRTLARHPEWDAIVAPRIPPELADVYAHNIDARRQLTAMGGATAATTLPAWRIVAPAPAQDLLGYYREAETDSGVSWTYLAAINLVETVFGRIDGVSIAGAQGPMQFMPATFAEYGRGGDINSARDAIMTAGRYLAANGFATDRDHAVYRYNNSEHYVRAVGDYAAVLAADPGAFAGYYRWEVHYNTTAGDIVLPIGYSSSVRVPVTDYLRQQSVPRISAASEQILQRLLAVARAAAPAATSEKADALSREFLGTPYGAGTLVGSQTVPEQLVIELEKVDCFTYADYVEALKRAGDREAFIRALIGVRYRNAVVGFQTRKHFFTDWSAVAPPVATDITASLGANTIERTKHLNEKDSGGQYLPGLPTVERTITYIPSADVDDDVLGRLHTGDYVGAFAADGGLDVTHVGIFVASPGGPVLRNASSLSQNDTVVDSPFLDYLRTVPGIVVLRPVQ